MEIGAITTLIFDKFQVLRNNNFIENNNCYETSILFKSGNNFSSVEENIENFKDKLLSSYWTEINLIGYKIELLEKQKVEYPKELKIRIIEIEFRFCIAVYVFIAPQIEQFRSVVIR